MGMGARNTVYRSARQRRLLGLRKNKIDAERLVHFGLAAKDRERRKYPKTHPHLARERVDRNLGVRFTQCSQHRLRAGAGGRAPDRSQPFRISIALWRS